MKKDGKYRFTLQFPADSEENIRVGDFLERMGNRKSAMIVMALVEYLTVHPELAEPSANITIRQEASVDRTSLKTLIRELIEEQLKHRTDVGNSREIAEEDKTSLEEGVTEMLGNLEMFF